MAAYISEQLINIFNAVLTNTWVRSDYPQEGWTVIFRLDFVRH